MLIPNLSLLVKQDRQKLINLFVNYFNKYWALATYQTLVTENIEVTKRKNSLELNFPRTKDTERQTMDRPVTFFPSLLFKVRNVKI